MNPHSLNTIKLISKSPSSRYDISIRSDNNGKKYLVKSVKDKSPNKLLLSLEIEREACTTLSKYSDDILKFPKIIKGETKSDKGLIVYEYIEGKSLKEFSSKYQVKIFRKIIERLNALSTIMSKEDMSRLPRRGLIHLIISIPYFYIKLLVAEPSKIFSITKITLLTFLNLNKLWSSKLYISHRDLKPENVIIKNRVIYLLDCESIALTQKDFDFNKMIVSSVNSHISSELIKELGYGMYNKWLANYICMNYGSSTRGKPDYSKNYINHLFRLNNI